MRLVISIAFMALAGPAGAALLAHGSTTAAGALASVSSVLPDPAIAAVMFAGFGLVAGARRARSNERAD